MAKNDVLIDRTASPRSNVLLPGTALIVSFFLLGIVNAHPAAGQCLQGWHYFDGSCYGLGTEPLPWMEAQIFCRVFDGHLAEIEAVEENQFLQNLSRKYPVPVGYFLGGTDMVQQGDWIWWSSKHNFSSFDDWVTNGPHQTPGPDCLAMFQNVDYSWKCSPCSVELNFICEQT